MSGDVRPDICVHAPATAEIFVQATPLHKVEEEALTVKFLPLLERAVERAWPAVQRGYHVPKFVNDIPAP